MSKMTRINPRLVTLSHNKLNHLASSTRPSIRRGRPSDDASLLRKSILILNSIQFAQDVAAEEAWKQEHRWFEEVMEDLGTDDSDEEEQEEGGKKANALETPDDDQKHYPTSIIDQSPLYTYSPPVSQFSPLPSADHTSSSITSSPSPSTPSSPRPASFDSFSDDDDFSDDDSDGLITPPTTIHDSFSFDGDGDDYEFGRSDDEGDFIEDTRSSVKKGF